MQNTLAKQLNESRRDALQAYYLGYVAPHLPGVRNQVVTEEDIYQYLLIDTEVSEAVKTSPVAQAIASLQQYLYRIALNQEPGFNPMSPEEVASWRSIESQYAQWSASQQVSDYPENYISPSTRQNKSHFFTELETTLNQNQLNADRVQSAVLSYLNEFEAVSNLQVINGYCDQTDFGKGTYYFIGRTAAEPYKYYWRSMDLSKNGGTTAHPDITPNCWNDWQAIGLPLNSRNVLSWTVRPVFFNNRLYVSWAERNPTPKKKSDGTTASPEKHTYSVHYGYLCYDGTWSAPNTAELQGFNNKDKDPSHVLPNSVLEIEEDSEFKLTSVDTVAIVDFSRGLTGGESREGNLFIGLFVYQDDTKGKIPKQAAFLFCDTSFILIETLRVNVVLDFAVYKLETTKDKIRQRSLQYNLQRKKYQIVESPLTNTSHHDSGIPDSWPGALATPTVSIDRDGVLRVEAELGQCPDDKDYDGNYVDGGQWKYIYDFTKEDQVIGGTDGVHYVLSPTSDWERWNIKFYFDGSDYYFYDTTLGYDANYGVRDVPAGSYEFVRYANPSYGPYNIFVVNIDDNNNLYFNYKNKSTKLSLHGKSADLVNLSPENILFSFSNVNHYNQPFEYVLSNRVIKNGKIIATTYRCQHKLSIYSVEGKSAVASNATPQSYILQPDDTCIITHPISSQDDSEIITYHLRNEIIRTPFSNNKPGSAGSAYQGWSVKAKLVAVDSLAQVPQLCTRYDSQKGNVQFITFNGITSEEGGKGFKLRDTRLNTTFVRELIRRANVSLGTLLNYTTQAMPQEPNLTIDSSAPGGTLLSMDFNSANGLYFWELFFHLPFLVATRFSSENQNSDAQHWLHYIFDPAAKDKHKYKVHDAGTGTNITPPDYWNVYPLCPLEDAPQVSTTSYLMADALDPYAQAYANPVIYQKAVFLAYVRTLIAAGDNQYRLLTPDGLTAARVFYDQALELMGPSPTVAISSRWTPDTLKALADKTNEALRAFERESDIPLLALPVRKKPNLNLLSTLDNANFRAPLNTQLLTYWQTLDARLYNLRHSLTIDGKPLNMPLYATPANPLALLTQRAPSGSLGSSGNGASQVILPYRFRSMLPIAYHAVDTLSQFGNTLLSLLERGDNAHQAELAQQQLVDLSSFTLNLQQQALSALKADVDTLDTQKAMADQRHQYYLTNYTGNISSAEQQSMDLQTTAIAMGGGEAAMYAVAGGLNMAPNVFGMADGGSRWGAAVHAVGVGMSVSRAALEASATRLAQSEGYRRRRNDWKEQYEQAQLESQVIEKQLHALTLRQQAAQTAIDQVQTQQAQQQAMLNFLTSRFTQASLYPWLTGQVSALYYQAYDAVLSLCLNVQACWQYELGDYSANFIQTNAWNDTYRGLLVGETLSLNLHQMEAAYLSRHDRRLNITRTFSLKTLLGDSPDTGFVAQKEKGTFTFTLSERDFDNNYPGHYARCLQQVSITLPTLMGPYQNVQALLTQTRSQTLLKPDINGVNYLNSSETGQGTHVVTNLRPSQQVALSGGLDDTGTFALLAQDGRYLPFEGTGAVSSWTLTFPRAVKEDGLPPDTEQKAILDALDDVLVQVQYTALDGGATFATEVRKELLNPKKKGTQ
ncbi:hypothetical protein DFQ28_007419 [Apophysomyces sp. BC1034]|nr:hypothetical protein DFQ28_007419 [Apophysomyces sp. BC1034]